MFIANVGNEAKIDIDELISSANGLTDMYGNPFSCIDLVYSSKNGNNPHRETGYEDTILTIEDGTNMPSIEYRQPGTLDFRKDKFGILRAKVAKTAHNMKILASRLNDGYWTIMDKKDREEIKRLSDDLMNNRTPEQVEIDHRLAINRGRMRYDGTPSATEVELQKELLKSQDELRLAKSSKVIVKEVIKEEVKPEAPKPIKIKKPSNSQEYWALKKQAIAMGLDVPKKIKTPDLKALIEKGKPNDIGGNNTSSDF